MQKRKRYKCREQTLDLKERREEGSGMSWEIEIVIYTLLILCVRYITSENENPLQCSEVT